MQIVFFLLEIQTDKIIYNENTEIPIVFMDSINIAYSITVEKLVVNLKK